MKSSVYAATAAALVLAACATEQSVAPSGSSASALRSGVLKQNFDTTVRAQDDFYRHVNGLWLATTEIPSDRSNYGTFTLLAEGAEHNLRTILEEASASKDAQPGSHEQWAGDLYASFMDTATIEARGLEPLAAELKAIDAIASKADLARYIGHLQRFGVGHPFGFFVSIDRKNSTNYLPVIVQSGLSMPDRDYYLSDDARLKGIRAKYQQYVRDLLAASGVRDADAAAAQILALETRIASAHWTRVQNRDAEKTYNRRDIAALRKMVPAFDWDAFLQGAGVPAAKVEAVSVTQPSYFEALNGLFAQTPPADWQRYLRFKLLNAYAPALPEQFANLHFEFNDRTVSGIEQMKPRWKRAVETVDNSIGEVAGRLYVERHFSPKAKERIQALVDNLIAAYSEGIDDLEWMTPETKVRAHAKLAQFTTKIGYPSVWREWPGLVIRRDEVVGNQMRAAEVRFDRNVARLGGPVDRTEWRMTPQTVNAYYSPPSNEIVFPAAILQPPFFDPEADDAVNYGGIGSVIGHEISHGFDDQGRRYDGAGNLSDWWAPQDNEEFTRRAKALGAQYNALSPMPDQHVNGDLTMGENIADLAGVAMAYRAYQLSLKGKPAPVIDGLSGDQRFFTGWAQVWARKYRDDELRKRLLTDPHAPSEYRTNNILSNIDPFHAAFGVEANDRMFRPAQERVKIW